MHNLAKLETKNKVTGCSLSFQILAKQNLKTLLLAIRKWLIIVSLWKDKYRIKGNGRRCCLGEQNLSNSLPGLILH